MKEFQDNEYAFTLAEVLITLVIIGVIAAITVPSLMNKTQNQEYVSKLKKAYSTLSQATNQIIAEEGLPKYWATSDDRIYNLYKKHLNTAKECSGNGCWSQDTLLCMNGSTCNSDINIGESNIIKNKLVLADGVQLIFTKISGGYNFSCDHNVYGSNNVCYGILVDTNGAKKPNQRSRDTFMLVLKENGLYPAGCDTGTCPEKDGFACTCKVLREGAMNY